MRKTITLSVMLCLVTALPSFAQDGSRRQQQVLFRFAFSVEGIEFSEDQQAIVEELRQKYTPQLIAVQRKEGSVLTAEQRRARQEAFRAAREARKSG